MPGKSPGPSIKKPKVYEALKREGFSKTSAAKISNAQAKKRKRKKTKSGGKKKTRPFASTRSSDGKYPI